jgi:hypothetical protein
MKTQEFDIPKSDDWEFGSDYFALECWVYIMPTGGGQSILTYGGNSHSWSTTDGMGWRMYYNGSNRIYMQWNRGGSEYGTYFDGFYEYRWTHLAMSDYGSGKRFHINGTERWTSGSYHTINSILYPQGVRIGDNFANSEPFKGFMDEIRITKGNRRWNYSFTTPLSPYPDYM